STILDLNQFCYFALFKQIRLSCEQTNENQSLDDLKYMDLKNFLSIYPPFRLLFYEWDKDLSERLFLLSVSSVAHICIDFAELYERLKEFPEKVKQDYWNSLTLAIKENDCLSSVELRYYPKTHHREHMDVFESVMKQLRAKKGIKKFKLVLSLFPGYTLEDLNGFDTLEELHLDVNVDIEELTECCRKNKGLTFLSVCDQQSGGRRLADIVPFCCQVRKFAFKMKLDCDASEYAPFAKMPALEKLHIMGEHEEGTLEALFEQFSRTEPEPLLSSLFIEDAALRSTETTELSRIESLTKLRYRCTGSEDLGPLVQMTNLNYLDILSYNDFQLIGDQICRILQYSKGPRKIFLPGCLIRYYPKEYDLLLVLLKNQNAADYVQLLRLPKLNRLEINGHHKPGSLVGLFDELARSEVSELTIGAMNGVALVDLMKKGWNISYLDYPLINAPEILALSRCKSLKKLLCGFADTRNIELIAELSQLGAFTITTKPANGSLELLFKDLAASSSPSLRDFVLSNGRIGFEEAAALARIGSLKSLDLNFYTAGDIVSFSCLDWAKLDWLRITSANRLQEISDVILKVSQFGDKALIIHTADVKMQIYRQQKHLELQMDDEDIYLTKAMLNSFANVEWIESLDINIKPVNLSMYFRAISTSGNCQLKKFRLQEGFLDSNETEELGKIKSLKEFHGRLINTQSLEHLRHLSLLNIENSFENRLPKHIVHTLDSIKEELTIRMWVKEVSYNINTGTLILSNTGAKDFLNPPSDATDFAPLAKLKNLHSVRIFGTCLESSLQLFFSQLASRQGHILQELIVESELAISSAELKDITSVKSLRKLKCGFSEAQNLELIAGLPQLTELVITTHHEGSLKDLLLKINSMESPCLKYLAVEGGQLTAEEEMQVAAMRSLKRLECGYSSTVVALGYRGHQTVIGEMTVTKDRQDISLAELFRTRPFLKTLIMTTLVITSREHSLANFENTSSGDTIARLPQDIKRDMLSFDGFEGLVQVLDPQRLVIELPPEMHCLKFLLEALALNKSQNLHQLVIRHRYIGLEEAASVAQISSLKRLMCGLEDPSGLSYLCNLKKLERLEITSMENFGELSHHLVGLLQSCRAFESIDLDFNFPVQFIKKDFLLQAVNALRTVRNSRTQSPLKLRFPP
ncbi:hypothetical protein KR054_002949, partial [Drosophila jambulina]